MEHKDNKLTEFALIPKGLMGLIANMLARDAITNPARSETLGLLRDSVLDCSEIVTLSDIPISKLILTHASVTKLGASARGKKEENKTN